MLVTFSGIDCSGKSTQIARLIHNLKQVGRRSICIWSRGGYTPGFMFVKHMARRMLGRRLPGPGQSQARDRALSNSRISRLWLSLAMLDLILLYGVVLRWHQLLGRVVICDRYLDDTDLDFSLNFRDSDFHRMILWRLLRAVAPRPDVSFLILVPIDVTMARSKEKDEPFPETRENIERRLLGYRDQKRFPESRYVKMDGCESMERQARSVLEHVAAV
jgi:dTMP kinase